MATTPITDPIASLDLICIRGTGHEIPFRAEVGRPYLVSGTEWACPVALHGVERQYPDSHGEGSMQALALAMSLLRRWLHDLIIDQGCRFVYPGSRHDWDISSLNTIFGQIW